MFNTFFAVAPRLLAAVLLAVHLLALGPGLAGPRRRPWRWAALLVAAPGLLGLGLVAALGLARQPTAPMAWVLRWLWPWGVATAFANALLAAALALLDRLLRGQAAPTSAAPVVDPGRRQALQAGVRLAAGAAAWAWGIQSSGALEPLAERRLSLAYPGLHPDLDGFTIAQLTDSHIGPFRTDMAVLAGAMAAVRRERPDLFVFGGDLCDHRPWLDEAFRVCGDHGARLGGYFILGNHEYYVGLNQVLDAMARQSGVELLADRAAGLAVGAARLHLSGTTYPFGGAIQIDEAKAAGILGAVSQGAADADFHLCLAHHPWFFRHAAGLPIHLMLSGHTHGGQVGIAGRSIFAPFFPYVRGHYRRSGQHLFVSSGLGSWFPLRVGTPPEMVLITLRRA